MERQTLPKMHQARITLDNPSQADLYNALVELREEGVPPDARIRFSQWNMPHTRWYLIASWVEYDDGSTGQPQDSAEYIVNASG